MPPLHLYARVRTFFCAHAHETSGAVCTRPSLRPRYFKGAERRASLGQMVSRECEAASRCGHCGNTFVVLAKARTHYPECELLRELWPQSRSQPSSVVMGPGFRQDDDGEGATHTTAFPLPRH